MNNILKNSKTRKKERKYCSTNKQQNVNVQDIQEAYTKEDTSKFKIRAKYVNQNKTINE